MSLRPSWNISLSLAEAQVPMLDLKVWINENDHNKIYYNFYEKQTICAYVMTKDSAIPLKKKIEFLSRELFRRFHNTKKEINDNILCSGMNGFDMLLTKQRQLKYGITQKNVIESTVSSI